MTSDSHGHSYGVTEIESYDASVAHSAPPDARVGHHLQPLLEWLQSDLMELASLLSVSDKDWFLSEAGHQFDTALRFDDGA